MTRKQIATMIAKLHLQGTPEKIKEIDTYLKTFCALEATFRVKSLLNKKKPDFTAVSKVFSKMLSDSEKMTVKGYKKMKRGKNG